MTFQEIKNMAIDIQLNHETDTMFYCTTHYFGDDIRRLVEAILQFERENNNEIEKVDTTKPKHTFDW